MSGSAWPEGMDGRPSSVGEVTLPGTFLVLAVTVHMLRDNGTLKDGLIDVELSTSMYLFYRDIL